MLLTLHSVVLLVQLDLLLVIPLLQAIHRTFTVPELRHTFGVDRHDQVPEYNLLTSVKRELSADGTTRKIQFRAWNTSFLIELRPNHRLISPHMISVVRHANQTISRQGLPRRSFSNCHFHGHVLSHGGFRAAISDCHRLMGIIVQKSHFLVLQTVPERMRRKKKRRRRRKKRSDGQERDAEYLVYKRTTMVNSLEEKLTGWRLKQENGRGPLTGRPDTGRGLRMVSRINEETRENYEEREEEVKSAAEAAAAEDGQLFCDVSTDNGTLSVLPPELANYTLPSAANLNSLFIFPQLDPITLEIGLFLDSMLFEHFRREFTAEPEQHLTDFSLALINNVHVLYQQPSLSPNLDIVVVHFELWKAQPAPLATELHRNGQAQSLLDSFCRHQARVNPGTDLTDPNHWDHAVLLTGYDIYHTTSSVAGVAPVGRMCDELFACSLVEGLHLGRSFVLAHEMGHNMGMVHDGVQNQCGRSCCLMSAVNGAGKTTWSSCSVREFNSFLLQLDESGRGNCLRDPAESIASHDHLKDGRLPGQRFTADQQCSYFWGRDFQVEIPNGRSFEDICRILWCGNSGSTISTAHPALEGSWCGDQRWCHRGQCEEWHSEMGAFPTALDGKWSDWTSAEKQSNSELALLQRKCLLLTHIFVYFGPNNGGRTCEGSNVRGIVCGGSRSLCEGFTGKEFGDRLCSAILHDQIRPDKQLSGDSFLHQSQPCKIWCHVRDSELIRNKGQFPNGSPCGPNHFCVGGVCLMMGCDGRALVQSPSDCPSADSTELNFIISTGNLRKHSTKAEKWDQWGQWSVCSATCGDFGVQKRTRKCRFPVESECAGKDSEVRACDPTPSRCEAMFSEWTEWSDCDGPCGQKDAGRRRRRRKCMANVADCTEATVEEEPCRRVNCSEWGQWTAWTECVGRCGEEGERSRERKCSAEGGEGDAELGCEGHSVQRERCNETKCEMALNDERGWGEWQPCSVSCGIGFQFRERLCGDRQCAGSGKQARTCNVQDCSRVLDMPVWSEWSLWSVCSRTCGQGVQQRFRRCMNGLCSAGESLKEQKRCVLGPCPQWSIWSQWTKCASCSVFETRKRQRQCVVKVAIAEGQQEETELGQEACSSGAPIEFDTCERSCAEEESAKVHGVKIVQATGNVSESLTGSWTQWGDWSQCSATCGNGTRRRERTCEGGGRGGCGWQDAETEQCREQRCEGHANAHNVSGNALAEATKSVVRYPTWSEWSEWSACSCFSLKRYRRRFCRVHDPQLKGFCAGSIIDQSPCIPPDLSTSLEGKQCVAIAGSWSAWSEWSDCSQDCGTRGHRIRNRMCANPLPSNRGSYCVGFSFDQVPCDQAAIICRGDPIDGRWSEWSDWSQCSNPCANGQRSRSRYCSNPRPQNGGKQCSGTDFELQACSEPALCQIFHSPLSLSPNVSSTNTSLPSPPQPLWGPWSPWSNCTSNCAFALRRRFRLCELSKEAQLSTKSCEGIAQMTAMCDTPFSCPNDTAVTDGRWTEWSEWSAANCEWGTCNGGRDSAEDEEMGEEETEEDGGGSGEEETPTEEDREQHFGGYSMALAHALNTRTRTRACSAPSPGGTPCFGPSSQRTSCPKGASSAKCDRSSTSVLQLISNIWQMDNVFIRRMILVEFHSSNVTNDVEAVVVRLPNADFLLLRSSNGAA
uniref:Peptidase M12B domain-containing protein n=1 Tax=Globodera rostochiensis TaxID=31243 RepID=A0A914HYA2_GLORO